MGMGHGLLMLLRCLCLLALTVCVDAHANNPTAEQKQAQLQELKSRIDALKNDIAHSEASRAGVADHLRETEKAMAEASNRLRDLLQHQAMVQNDLYQLQHQTQQLQYQVDAQQKQLANLLHRQYRSGSNDGLSQYLNGADPNQAARDSYYLRSLSQAKLQWLSGLRTAVKEKSRLAEAVKLKAAELNDIQAQSRQQQAELQEQQQRHKAMLEKISAKLKSQRQEFNTMRQDESRLTKLIEGLARIVRRPPPSETKGKGGTEITSNNFVAASGVRFRDLKGRLPMPVKGTVTHSFGSRQSEGRSTWKGVFIRSNAGNEVKAVAAGRVVFADSLRGFGNLIILDHGDEYLTVYGNNQALRKHIGDRVNPGEGLASVGSSGGNDETGLYFELRFQGQVLDPLKWSGHR